MTEAPSCPNPQCRASLRTEDDFVHEFLINLPSVGVVLLLACRACNTLLGVAPVPRST
jgi:hypothetical protein